MTFPFHDPSRPPAPASLSHALHSLGSGARPALRRAESPATHDPSDTEQRLEQELSQLLSRRPVRNRNHQALPINTYAAIEPDEPPPRTMPCVGPHAPSPNGGAHAETVDATSDTGCNAKSDDEPAGNDAEAYDEIAPRPQLEPGRTNWFLTARRARRNRRLRFIASWLITILVGGFIICVAAMILFGMPVGKFAVREQTLEAAKGYVIAAPATMAPSQTRWQLD